MEKINNRIRGTSIQMGLWVGLDLQFEGGVLTWWCRKRQKTRKDEKSTSTPVNNGAIFVCVMYNLYMYVWLEYIVNDLHTRYDVPRTWPPRCPHAMRSCHFQTSVIPNGVLVNYDPLRRWLNWGDATR
jgi:hypothetical protein